MNATNHHFDPDTFLRQMPLDHLIQAHLAGGYWSYGWLVDGHRTLVPPEVLALLTTLSTLCQVKNVLLEHDAHVPGMTDLLERMDHARSILNSGEAVPRLLSIFDSVGGRDNGRLVSHLAGETISAFWHALPETERKAPPEQIEHVLHAAIQQADTAPGGASH